MLSGPPDYSNVLQAHARLQGFAIKTPLVRSSILDEMCAGRVFFKAENLQRTGSFKFRGATNAIRGLMDDGADLKKTGVIACSSGNHAQGIAEAARMNGISATIVMPSDAPQIKVERTKRSGADVLFYDRASEDRDVVTADHAARLGAELVHPFNNPYVIAGQGTCALEAADDLETLGEAPDHILVCTGGGGLSAGVALVAKQRFPRAEFHTVEPIGFDDYKRSLEAGERLSNAETVGSVCDAILTPQPGENGFAIINGYAGESLLVSDEEALNAVAFAFHEMKLVVEPGGAVTLAALLSGKLDVRGKCVLATISGGNVDPEMHRRALSLS